MDRFIWNEDDIVIKELPSGTRTQRKDGIYEKQPDGSWSKIIGKLPSKQIKGTDKEIAWANNEKEKFKNKLNEVKNEVEETGTEEEKNAYDFLIKKIEAFDTAMGLVKFTKSFIRGIWSYIFEKEYRDDFNKNVLPLIDKEEKYQKIRLEGKTLKSKVCKVQRKTVRGYLSPEPGDISEHENDILANAYASARESGKDKETSSKIAWAAVNRYREGKKTMQNKAEKVCTPRSGEKQNDFISRCIKEEMDKGTPQDQAKGKCYGIWRGEKTKEARKTILQSVNRLAKYLIKKIRP